MGKEGIIYGWCVLLSIYLTGATIAAGAKKPSGSSTPARAHTSAGATTPAGETKSAPETTATAAPSGIIPTYILTSEEFFASETSFVSEASLLSEASPLSEASFAYEILPVCEASILAGIHSDHGSRVLSGQEITSGKLMKHGKPSSSWIGLPKGLTLERVSETGNGADGADSADSVVVKEIDSINRLAVKEWGEGNFQTALVHIKRAYEKARGGKYEVELAKVLNTLGLVYWRLGNNADAMQSYLESSRLAEKHSMLRLLGLTHTNMGLIYKEKGEFSRAFMHNNKAINIFNKEKSYRELGIACNNQGQIYKNMGKLDSARYYYQEALKQYTQIDYTNGKAATWYNLADIYLRMGKQGEALSAARLSLQLGLKEQSDLRISEAYQKISQIYEKEGNADSALRYFRLLYEVNNRIVLHNQSQRLAELQAMLGAEVKNLQIENLRNEKKLAVSRNWLMGISMLILLSAAAFVLYRYYMRLKFRKENLERELLNASKIIEVKEQELKSYIIDLTRKNAMLSRMQDEVTRSVVADGVEEERVEQLLEQKILTDEDWTTFKSKFKSIYPGFFTRIRQLMLNLTEAEERLLVLIYLDMSGKEMANTLGISPQSVRVCKMRLKKKLQEKGIETVEVLLAELVK